MRIIATDNIQIEVCGNTIFITNSVNSLCIKWSTNPDFIKWIRDNDNTFQEYIYNEKYNTEFNQLIIEYKLW